MQIWVDADACPGEIKTLLYRAAERRKIKVTLVANQPMRTPTSEFIEFIWVPGGMNVVDRRIMELAEAGDGLLRVGDHESTSSLPAIALAAIRLWRA